MNDVEIRDVLEARIGTYTFLSALFLREAPIALLEELAQNAEAYEGAMGEYALSLRGADMEQARIDATAEFSKLLLGMSSAPVAPYESVYSSDLHLMMQEPRDKVVALYASQGFKCIDGLRLPEDHLGIECEFMASMCRKELEALDACDAVAVSAARQVQIDFVKDHLMNWVPALCEDMLVRYKTGLYAGLAEITAQFIEYEAEDLGIS